MSGLQLSAFRHLPLPLDKITPELGRIWLPVGYLTDTILTRDMLMHRLDVSRATKGEMLLTGKHDGRITALVVRGLARALTPESGKIVVYALQVPAGGTRRTGPDPRTTIRLDTLMFDLLASGRRPLQEVRVQVSIEGDAVMAEQVLQSASVPY